MNTSLADPTPRSAVTTRPTEGEQDFRERLRDREQEALERFFHHYFDAVHARIRGSVRSAQEAEDLTQDVFLKIHRSLPRFDASKQLDPWVTTIVRNRVRDHWRARRMLDRSEQLEDLFESRSAVVEPVASATEREEYADGVHRAIERLSRTLRSVMLLRTYDGLSFEAIARMLKLPSTTVRKRYSRGLHALRALLPLEGIDFQEIRNQVKNRRRGGGGF